MRNNINCCRANYNCPLFLSLAVVFLFRWRALLWHEPIDVLFGQCVQIIIIDVMGNDIDDQHRHTHTHSPQMHWAFWTHISIKYPEMEARGSSVNMLRCVHIKRQTINLIVFGWQTCIIGSWIKNDHSTAAAMSDIRPFPWPSFDWILRTLCM